MYRISRQLSFCYGHRLLQHAGKCSRLHGHNAVVVMTLEAESLDALGMVADFQVIRDRIGSWIDEHLDHRMILHRDDPAVVVLRDSHEDVCIVEFTPTAENLARFLHDRARESGLPVVEVEFWETPICKATYRP